MDEPLIFIRGMVTPFITDMGEKLKMTNQKTGKITELPRFAYWDDMGRNKAEVKECSDDLEYLKKKYNVPDNHVVDMKKIKQQNIQESAYGDELNANIIVDRETVGGYRVVNAIYLMQGFQGGITKFKTQLPNIYKDVIQFVDPQSGETVKGPKYDTTSQKIKGREVQDTLPSGLKQKEPIEPTQYEPRDRYQENTDMNEINKFRNIVRECISEIKHENDPKTRLKESLRGVVKDVLKEIANVSKPEPSKEEKEKVSKGYSKNGNERLDKTNEKLRDELETIVHGIDPTWNAYWDDHGQLIVRAQNLLYVRICPKFEDNFDVDAMVKLVDRVRAIALTWEQVKSFIKANFSDLKNKTIPDQLRQRSLDHHDDRDVIKKAAGPMGGAIKNRGEKKNGEDAKIKDTKKDDKNYNEPMTKRDEDMPDQPMKKVTEPGKDPESKNKNIDKTSKVKAPKHKNDKSLKQSDKKTPKFSLKQVRP